jgi:putative transcriptional regulator
MAEEPAFAFGSPSDESDEPLRQYEIARTMPPPAVRAYLTVIEREPEMAARALHPDAT